MTSEELADLATSFGIDYESMSWDDVTDVLMAIQSGDWQEPTP
jgi:hypothetical protein